MLLSYYSRCSPYPSLFPPTSFKATRHALLVFAPFQLGFSSTIPRLVVLSLAQGGGKLKRQAETQAPSVARLDQLHAGVDLKNALR